MADLLWSDVVEVTHEQAKQSLLLMLEDAELPATSWQPFAIAPLCVNIGAELQSQGSKISVLYKNAFQAETATGEALTRTSSGFFDNTRNAAQKSQHLVTFALAAGEGPHPINLGDLVLNHPQGATFRNNSAGDTTYPYAFLSGTSVTLLFDAEVAGSASNIATALTEAAVTLELNTTLSGVTITAHELIEAGVDEEDDPRLKDRNQLKWASLAPAEGTDDYVKLLALEAAPTIVHVAVDSTNPRGAGTFDVYIAGLDATASDDDRSKAQVLIERRFFGRSMTPPAVLVKKSPTVDVELVGTVYHSGNYSQADVRAAVDEALLAFIRSTPSGGWDFSPGPSGIIALNDLENAIKSAQIGAAFPVRTVQLTTPSGDMAIPQFGRPVFVGTTTLTYQATTTG